MKTCSKCGDEKKEIHFSKKHTSKDGLNPQCKECTRKYTKSHYKKNKEYYKDKARKNAELVRDWFNEYKSHLKCELCPENHPATLDFHHIDPSKKEDCIATIVHNGSLDKIKKELKKCRVFCANCHRKFHYKENAPEAQLDEQLPTKQTDG